MSKEIYVPTKPSYSRFGVFLPKLCFSYLVLMKANRTTKERVNGGRFFNQTNVRNRTEAGLGITMQTYTP